MPTPRIQPPYHPIIYVRGYAATGASVEQTVATPYMGFNRGSTKIRQRWTGEVVRHIFESPLIRLMKDHGYHDAYHEGDQFGDGRSVGGRSVFVYRYYDQVSGDLGTGNRPEIETYAQGLSDFILRVHDAVCGDDSSARSACRVYLVAHSMGGLICRCFLQNPRIGTDNAKRLVDKVFTYATPHNGIDLNVIGNVPGIFGLNNADSFNRARMAEYLDLAGEPSRVDELGGWFDPKRFFCLVGTNDRDDESAGGWARRVVGPMSDGLVRIKNASVRSAPRAFVHRSHSGDYGIVNSEEGYQNLVRFLFGDVRVDGKLIVQDLRLPWALQRAFDRGKTIRASYHFEVVIRTRGASWDLHRRTVAEHSAIFRRFDEMLRGPDAESRCPYLFSTFLSARARVNSRRPSLGFSVDLGVLVPHYEIDNALWFDDHYDGGYLFRDKLNFQITRSAGPAGQWTLRYGLDSRTPNRTTRRVEPTERDGAVMFAIPIQQRSRPGIDAELHLIARSWNH